MDKGHLHQLQLLSKTLLNSLSTVSPHIFRAHACCSHSLHTHALPTQDRDPAPAQTSQYAQIGTVVHPQSPKTPNPTTTRDEQRHHQASNP